MSNRKNDIQNLTGKILLATPNISDVYMHRSMIFICKHSAEGAMGVAVNKILPEINLLQILTKIELGGKRNIKIHIGGDKDLGTCYILHTNQNLSENTTLVHDNVFLTACDDIMKSFTFITKESERKILCLGCYYWKAQELENEISSNYWIPIPSDEALIFGESRADKWSKAFLKIGLRSPLFLDKFGRA